MPLDARFFVISLFAVPALLLSSCTCEDVGESGDDAADQEPSSDDTGADDDAADDSTDDTADDDTGCTEGETTCSDDALKVLACAGGAWRTEKDCMDEEGRLCEGGACVDPWRYGSPAFDSCAGDPDATGMTLVEKAAKYDGIAARLHVHPEDKRLHHVTIEEGYTEDDADWHNVIDWHTGENDGLWTGLYIASQVFRYAVTHEESALDNLRLMTDGLLLGTRITGVPGLFTREYITPGIAGMSCPADPGEYVPDVEKDDNQWVKVDADGTILTYDDVGSDWVRTDHQVPEEFAGYCFLDNVSKDEYAGHMLALGLIWLLVDDLDVRVRAGRLLEEVAVHLMENDMAIRDWDGRITEHGRFWPTALDDWPAFNAVLGLNHVKLGREASGRADLADFYNDCLLQKNGPYKCLDQFLGFPISFADWLWWTGLYFGHDGCKSNWNNFGMMFLGIFTLIWYENVDLELREALQDTLETEMFYHHGNAREMARQHNAAWAMIYASMKNTGPQSTGQDVESVNDAICQLRKFPESKAQPSLDTGEEDFPTDPSCESRFDGEFLTFDPVPVDRRCPGTFTWWGNPYEHQHCDADPLFIRQPADYLLPYWMGRFFGYIEEEW